MPALRWTSMLHRGVRALLVAALVLVTVTANGAGAEVKIDDACTFVTTKQLGKAFGTPVQQTDFHTVGTYDCLYLVGEAPDNGTFRALQMFPTTLDTAQSARGAYEDEYAIGNLSDEQIEELDGIGTAAYLNRTTGTVVVQANRRFTFSVTWQRAPGGTPITNADAKRLTAIAKSVTKKVNKA